LASKSCISPPNPQKWGGFRILATCDFKWLKVSQNKRIAKLELGNAVGKALASLDEGDGL